MNLIFLSHLDWGSPETSDGLRSEICSDRSDVSMVAEPNGKCGDRYPYYDFFKGNQTAPVKWKWFLCKKTNTCIEDKAKLECFHLII